MTDIIFWKPNNFRGTLYSRAFEIADYEFEIGSYLGSSPNTLLAREKNMEKNSQFFNTFLQIWRHIGIPTGPNSILTTDS